MKTKRMLSMLLATTLSLGTITPVAFASGSINPIKDTNILLSPIFDIVSGKSDTEFGSDLNYLKDNNIIVSPIFDIVEDGFLTPGSKADVKLENVDMIVSKGTVFIEKPDVTFTPITSDKLSVNVAYEGDVSAGAVTSIKGAWSTEDNPVKVKDWTDISRESHDITSDIVEPGGYYYHVKMVLITGDEAYYKSDIIMLDGINDIDDAIASVEKAESTKTQTDVDDARAEVGKLPDGDIKDELTGRLDVVQGEIDKINNDIDDAIASVEKAESTKTQTDVDDARTEIGKLPEGDIKDELTGRLDVVQGEIDNESDRSEFDAAIEAVEKAESTKTQKDIDDARSEVSKLPSGPKKDGLNDRLDDLQSVIDKEKEDEEQRLQDLADATEAVKKAETFKDQNDIDDARDKVNQLPEGTEKEDLTNRLDDIQDEIDEVNKLVEATKAVEKAESTKTRADINKAYGLVNGLQDSLEKDDLLARLDVLQSEADKEDALEKARLAVERAERTESSVYINLAYDIVNNLPASSDKTDLLGRLDALQAKIDNELALRAATRAVDIAEVTKSEVNIDDAYILVNGLISSADKVDLLDRLQAIKDSIKKEQEEQDRLMSEAIAAVEKAEGSKTQADVDVARGLTNKLPLGNDRVELSSRLDVVQAEIDYNKLLNDAIRSVEKAESTKSQYDVNAAYRAVNRLDNGEVKTGLINRLKALENQIKEDDENKLLEIEAEKAVRKAEVSKSSKDIEDARDKVYNVKDVVVKKDLNDRLDNIEKEIEAKQEEQNVKRAESLVRVAEIFKTQSYIQEAITEVELLRDGEAKQRLMDKLDALGGYQSELEKRALKDAGIAVDRAEKFRFNSIIKAAQKAVDELSDSKDKTALQTRLDIIR